MDKKHIIPACAYALEFNDQLRPLILQVCPEAAVSAQRMVDFGSRHLNGMVTRDFHLVVATLNQRLPELWAWAQSHLAELDACYKMHSEEKAKYKEQALNRQGPSPKQRMLEEGPQLWLEWHVRALTHVGDDWLYIQELLQKLPCGECALNFQHHLRDHPPAFGDPKFSYFDWTVFHHNLVRKHQGKTEMGVEEARALYEGPAPIPR